MSDYSQHCWDAADALAERKLQHQERETARYEQEMADLHAAIRAARDRRAREEPRRQQTRVYTRPRVREMTEDEWREEQATFEYETSGGAWADRFAARPVEDLRFRESPGLDPRRGIAS